MSTYVKIGLVVVVVIIIIVILALSMSPASIAYEKQAPSLQWVSDNPGPCVGTYVANWCILDSEAAMQKVCNASSKCVGYSSKDGAWIGYPGKTMYQWTNTKNLIPQQSPLATIYFKK